MMSTNDVCLAQRIYNYLKDSMFIKHNMLLTRIYLNVAHNLMNILYHVIYTHTHVIECTNEFQLYSTNIVRERSYCHSLNYLAKPAWYRARIMTVINTDGRCTPTPSYNCTKSVSLCFERTHNGVSLRSLVELKRNEGEEGKYHIARTSVLMIKH